MTRALASLVILGCGGAKQAPPPAPLPPVASPLDAGSVDAAPPDGPAVADAPAPAAPQSLAMRPTVSIGKLSIFGALDATAATAVIRKFRGRFLYCYETALLRDPKLEGTVTLELAVETDGKVSSATAAGVDRDVDECLKHGALTIAFPAGKKTAKVSIPLAFQPPP